jgi:hypothetical protein
MLQYSGVEWGEADKWDMSRMNLTDFTEALELAVMNIHDAIEQGGVYGIAWATCEAVANTTT